MEGPQAIIKEVKQEPPKGKAREMNRPEEPVSKAPLDSVVVCGMGPVKLKDLKGSERLFPLHPYNRLNAIAAKLLASNGIVDTVITSGSRSGTSGKQDLEGVEALEQETSEGELLADTYDRARGKGVDDAGRIRAEKIIEIDSAAKTTFDNVIQALNALDAKNGGYWEGSIAILSSEFHVPRIREILSAFGISNARVLSAERILRHFGYAGRLYPTGDFGYGQSYEEFEESVYQGQPAGLENLQDNPSYVTFELAKIQSNRRFQEIVSSVKAYYVKRGISLPEVYNDIPIQYDVQFDYSALRTGLSQIPFSKHEYRGEEYRENTDRYRNLAATVGQETEDFLQSVGVI